MLVRYIKRSSLLIVLLALLISNGSVIPALGGGDPPPPGHPPTVFEFPINSWVYAPCANNELGEFIVLTGTVQVSAFGVEDANNTAHFRFNTAYQNVTGIGQNTGNTYHAVAQSISHVTIDEDINDTTMTARGHTALIGHGQAPNLKQHYNYRVIFYADGRVELVTSHFSVTCQ